MRVKTSITLSEDTLQALEEVTGPASNRSRTIEQAVIEFVERRRRELRETRDLEILNRSADALNREIEDVLAYQVDL
jgi:metal-responsive CopG/Arc/MetJ family transcriptional regulator